MPQGVFPDFAKELYYNEIEAARTRDGLSVHFHANPWFQAASQDQQNRFDLGGDGTAENPGVRWYFQAINKLEKAAKQGEIKQPGYYFAGVFVGGGSISDPASTSYHLEIQLYSSTEANKIKGFLNKYDFDFTMIQRRKL